MAQPRTTAGADRLTDCRSEDEQIGWVTRNLQLGREMTAIGLWLGGVDRPATVVGAAKAKLRAQGMTVSKRIVTVVDCADEEHAVLSWRVVGRE